MHWDMKCKAATAVNSQHEYEMNCLCWWIWTWIWNEYEYEINEWIWMNEKKEWMNMRLITSTADSQHGYEMNSNVLLYVLHYGTLRYI